MDAKDNRRLDKTGDGPRAWCLKGPSGLWSMALVAEDEAWSWSQDRLNTIAQWPGCPKGPKGETHPGYRQWLSSRTALYRLVEEGIQGLVRPAEGPPQLLLGQERFPVSLTHTVGMGGAAVASPRAGDSLGGIGVDLERCSDRHARVLGRVSSDEEIRRVQGLAGEEWGATLLWVIKEAAYKCNLIDGSQFGKNQEIIKLSINSKSIQGLPQGEVSTGLEPAWSGEVVQGSNGKETVLVEAGCLFHQGHAWLWAVAYPPDLVGNDHA